MEKVKLIALSQPRIEGVNTSEELIAYCARVSNPDNQMNALSAPKLVKYLMDNNHWSPLEMVSITLEINTTRDIARQILRHRSFSFQEFSQRYADASILGFETRECRMQDTKNRQNSIVIDDEAVQKSWQEMQQSIIEACAIAYTTALDNGVAKEQARAFLPEGLTRSRMYMSGTLRSWWHYCALRCAEGTQKEHQLIAKEVYEVLAKEYPSIFVKEIH
jgi:thymidylate synthase (FAD)